MQYIPTKDCFFYTAQPNRPRATSLSGRPLPTSRDVSLAVHTCLNITLSPSRDNTMAMVQFGQFLDHDIVLTPEEEGTFSKRLGHVCLTQCNTNDMIMQNKECYLSSI